MKSHKRSLKSIGGATIIEILIGIAIMAGLASFGFFIAMNQYRAYVLESDWDTAASLLQTARSRAMNNINGSDHGFYFAENDFIVFQGASYASRNGDYDEIIPRSTLVSVSGPEEIVFKRLRGDIDVSGTLITLSNGERSRTITLNNEGLISW